MSSTPQEMEELARKFDILFAKFMKIADGGDVTSSEESGNDIESDKGEASGPVEECVQDTPASESSDFFFFFGAKPIIENPEAISAEIGEELNVSRFDENNVETRKIICQMKNCLYQKSARNGGRPIILYPFIFDPQSFCRTIENIFHVSRLVEYGDVLFEWDKERQVLVLMPNYAGHPPSHRSTVPAGQLFLEMTKDDWAYLRAEFKVNEAVFKPTLD